MKREALVLSALVIAVSLCHRDATAGTITGMTTVKATSKGTVAKGPFTIGGVVRMTSDVQFKAAQDYIKRYEGPTDFKANYAICLQPDNTVDPAKSMVTFETLSYTVDGILNKSKFKTRPITITEVMLMNNDPTMIASFKFNSTDWYPADANGANGILNNGLSGSINLKNGVSSYMASYIVKHNGAIYTYMVTNRGADPFPSPEPTEFGDPELFTPLIPEPSSWILLLTGITGIAFLQQSRIAAARQRRR